MRRFDALVGHPLVRVRRLTPRSISAGRWTLALAVIASLLVSALSPPALAHADPPPEPPGPIERLQIVLTKIHVNNDRDELGSGEMQVHALICTTNFSGPSIEPACDVGNGVEASFGFSASTDQDVFPNRVIPGPGDTMHGESSAEAGIPIYPGDDKEFRLSVFEDDPIGGDDMGTVYGSLWQSTNWDLGTHTVGSDVTSDRGTYGPPDFELTWEVRRAPLPDLHVREFHLMSTGDDRFFCGLVENIGERPSGLSALTRGRPDHRALRPPSGAAPARNRPLVHARRGAAGARDGRDEQRPRARDLRTPASSARRRLTSTAARHGWRCPGLTRAEAERGAPRPEPEPVRFEPG
jgi:hypothetical protein